MTVIEESWDIVIDKKWDIVIDKKWDIVIDKSFFIDKSCKRVRMRVRM